MTEPPPNAVESPKQEEMRLIHEHDTSPLCFLKVTTTIAHWSLAWRCQGVSNVHVQDLRESKEVRFSQSTKIWEEDAKGFRLDRRSRRRFDLCEVRDGLPVPGNLSTSPSASNLANSPLPQLSERNVM